MSTPLKVIKTKEFAIEIMSDDYPASPRELGSDWSVMACFHSRYSIGDNHDMSPEDLRKIIRNKKKYVSLPVYLYDHSGLTINTTEFNCRWDSGQLGYIYVDKEIARERWSWKKITPKRTELLKQFMREEIEEYDEYLRGNVFGYRVIKLDEYEKEEDDMDDHDDCWGFYGEDSIKGGLIGNYCTEEEYNNAEEL